MSKRYKDATEAFKPAEQTLDLIPLHQGPESLLSVCYLLLQLAEFREVRQMNPRLTLILLPLIPIFLLTIHHFRKTLQQACEVAQEEGSATNVFLQEHLSSVTQNLDVKKRAFNVPAFSFSKG